MTTHKRKTKSTQPKGMLTMPEIRKLDKNHQTYLEKNIVASFNKLTKDYKDNKKPIYDTISFCTSILYALFDSKQGLHAGNISLDMLTFKNLIDALIEKQTKNNRTQRAVGAFVYSLIQYGAPAIKARFFTAEWLGWSEKKVRDCLNYFKLSCSIKDIPNYNAIKSQGYSIYALIEDTGHDFPNSFDKYPKGCVKTARAFIQLKEDAKTSASSVT